MAREGMLRNTGARAARGSVDTGQGVARTAGSEQREAHIGRGTFVNWYDDLGISATRPAADQIRTEEAAFKGKVAEQESRIAAARSQLDSAKGELASGYRELEGQSANLPDLGDATNESWNTYKSTLTPVRVIGRGDSIEATYYLPRETADNLMGQRGIFASYVDGGAYMNVMAKDYRNQELHDPLREAAASLEAQYRTKAQEQIAGQLGDAQGQFNESMNNAYGQLGEAGARVQGYENEINSATGMLEGVKQQHQAQWDEIHGKYKARAQKMNDILGSLFIGGQGDNGN